LITRVCNQISEGKSLETADLVILCRKLSLNLQLASKHSDAAKIESLVCELREISSSSSSKLNATPEKTGKFFEELNGFLEKLAQNEALEVEEKTFKRELINKLASLSKRRPTSGSTLSKSEPFYVPCTDAIKKICSDLKSLDESRVVDTIVSQALALNEVTEVVESMLINNPNDPLIYDANQRRESASRSIEYLINLLDISINSMESNQDEEKTGKNI
jgi:hypothetical protein